MIKTIYTIGKEISEGRDLWEDIIETKKEKTKEGIDYLVLNIIFDLEKEEIIISRDNLSQFDSDYESLKDLMYLKTLGRNMKSPYLCVDGKKVENLFKALFGKPDKKGTYPTKGDLAQAIELELPQLEDDEFMLVLEKLIQFKDEFELKFKNPKGKFTLEKVNELLEVSNRSKVMLIYPSIKSNDYENKALADFESYKTYLKNKYLESSAKEGGAEKLCYATGEIKNDTQDVSFSGRYNINKLFVKETKNYASNFNSKDFYKNYQVSEEIQSYLDRGSDYILNNLITTIADVRHVIIPQFLNSKKLTTKQLKSILSDTDLLFNSRKFSELEEYFNRKNIDEESEYWLNFVAIDSDGNYFKAANLIKNVSKFHFSRLISQLAKSGDLFAPWLGKRYPFNLNQMYRLIPVRKDKENVNQALTLFASILEGRKLEVRKLYAHFTELILCHWYGRYRSFTNVYSFHKDFDFAAKDAVFGYLTFINTLRNLNLLKNLPPMKEEPKESIGENLEIFFEAMDYQPAQQALFYLGRALSQAAYKQKEKGNKKAVLEKLNYNGMDKRSIYRLSTDLFEKGKQYNFVEKIQWNLGEFNQRFDFNNWNMNPQEALFFILSGYTYRIKSSQNTESESAVSDVNEDE